MPSRSLADVAFPEYVLSFRTFLVLEISISRRCNWLSVIVTCMLYLEHDYVLLGDEIGL